MSEAKKLDARMLQWQDQLSGLAETNREQVTRTLARSISSTVADLKVAYSKFNASEGTSNRYTIESQTVRFRELTKAAEGLIGPGALKNIKAIYENDLNDAYSLGTSASRDLTKIVDGADTSAQAMISKMPVAAQAAAGQNLMQFWDKEKAALTNKVREATLSALQRGKGWASAQKDIAQALRSSGQTILRGRDELSVTARGGIVMNLEQRADLIAKTEMANAYIQGQISQYKQNGYTHGRWSATGERTCPFCVSREGNIYTLDELEGAIPAHPRCRCTIAPVLEENVKNVQNARDQGASAALNLDDAGWTAIRQQRFNEYQKFTGKPLADPSRWMNAPTSRQKFLNPRAQGDKPAWMPSGNVVPNLEGAQAAAIRAKDLEAASKEDQKDLEAQNKEIEKQKQAAKLVKERKGEEFTFKRFSDATGDEPGPDTNWTSERQKLHDKIVQNFLKDGKKSATPTFTMSGGGPASGKGFMLKKTGLDQPGKVVIDADEIKKLIPEYAKAQKKGGDAQQAAAGVVHEESSYLAKRIMGEASKRGFDIVLDGTGDSGIKSLTKKVQKMRDEGYRVEGKYVSADTETAAQRNWDRFLKTGRLPPEWMLRNVHADVSRTLPKAMQDGLFDEIELYDTNKSGELRKVASQKGKNNPKIHDSKLWDDFKRKGEAGLVTKEQGERLIEARKLKVDVKAKSSHGKHSNARAEGAEPGPDTVWTLDRQKLHKEIVDKFLANGAKSANPTFTMSGGGPASGKGFMLKATGLDKPGKVVIDADEIKKLIPEYADAQKKGGKAQQQAAGYVHEESSYLAKRIMAEAAKRSYDVVLDGTGDSGINSLSKKVQKMRDQGYRVEAKYVSADTELAAQRNWDRFLKTGRLPPEWMLRNVHADVSRTLPEAMKKGLFDAVELFDTNLSGQLRKVVSQKGKSKPEILDKQLWNDFQNKGKAKQVTPEEGEAMIAKRKAETEDLSKTRSAGTGKTPAKTKPSPTKAKESDMVDRATRMKTSDVLADPSRFQYKVNSNSKTGEVGSLSGVKTWNEDLAGVLSVWKDPANGKTYVINGHNRLALAKKLGAKELPVVVINAKDAKAARSIGAKQNIANGDGTAIDAAKFMRDTNTTARSLKAQGLNLKGSIASDGAALANLPDHIFRAALEGRLSISRAAAIGRSGLSSGQMNSAYNVLKTKPSMSVGTLDEVLSNARASVTRTTSEETLFGTTTTQTSTLVERADLAAKLKADMGKEVRILDKAAGRADVLNSKGNRIDAGKAQVKAAEAQARLEVFELTKNSQGSNLNKTLNEAASAIQDAGGRSAKAQATKAGRTAVDQALDAEIAAMKKNSSGLLRSIADLKAVEAGKVARPPELALAAEAPDLTIDKRPTRLLDPKTAKAGSIGALRVNQIKADPKRFQYKAATVAATGEVGSLDGVQRFDPNLAGVISVWKDPANGQTYVINGHNRLAAAKRLGADDIAVRYLKADRAEDARSIGALANIAEGHGTALDAAKFMRAKGYSGTDMRARGIAMKKDVARDGAALANLPEEIFGDVVNENISIEKASAIGSGGLDQKGMEAVYRNLRTRPAASVKTVTELVAAEKMSMEMGSTGSLFAESADDLAYQMNRADLTGKVRDDLLKEKSLFKAVSTSRAARDLEKAGSTLDLAANSKAAAQAETILSVFDQLKNSSGPVASALSSGARDLAVAKTAAEKNVVRRRVMDDISKAVDQELGGNLGSVEEPPSEAPGQESLFGF